MLPDHTYIPPRDRLLLVELLPPVTLPPEVETQDASLSLIVCVVGEGEEEEVLQFTREELKGGWGLACIGDLLQGRATDETYGTNSCCRARS